MRYSKRVSRLGVFLPIVFFFAGFLAAEVEQNRGLVERGVRLARPEAVTITKIEPNYHRYDENDDAGARATIVNMTSETKMGTLIALMHGDLDTAREVARKECSIEPGAKQVWNFDYNVGPDEYGRGIEVRFVDESGSLIDTWQEFYHVTREWLRVQVMGRYGCWSQWTVQTEPSAFGVHTVDVELYESPDGNWRIGTQSHRQKPISYRKKYNYRWAFYQNNAFSGKVGYDQMRRKPQHVMYDENGQFAVDPVYGGWPDPMELASPVEIGPKRVVKKPYLDRGYTGWQHASANFASPKAVEYGARCITNYADEMQLDGVFLDALAVARKGYDYNGNPTLPEKKQEIARLNALVADAYMRTLKKDDPYFGTWFNFSVQVIEHQRHFGQMESTLGSGVDVGGVDVSDEWIRAITGWKNTMFLWELQGTLKKGRSLDCYPDLFLTQLLKNRDYIVQKYGSAAIVGYILMPVDDKDPGPTNFAWPTINYFMAVLTASQHHITSWARPSFDPALQFMTRYSRFLWARDIKAVPVDEMEKTMELKTPENLWWKQLVYERKTENGRDLIIHLVRIPPTEKWDLDLAEEPKPLEGAELTVDIGSAELATAHAMRPYYFEEEQQPVEKVLEPTIKDGKATVEIPPFRYHSMVVIRLKKL